MIIANTCAGTWRFIVFLLSEELGFWENSYTPMYKFPTYGSRV